MMIDFEEKTLAPCSALIEVDKTLESLRNSGFDLATASGEVVDNSCEANATIVRIHTIEKIVPTRINGKPNKQSKTIDSIVFADNGNGIAYEVLPSALKLGFSTRYNQRKGLGRFGVGMKLAAISQARRIDIYTRPLGDKKYYHAYLDLDEVSEGSQTLIKGEVVDCFPSEYSNFMQYPQSSNHPKKGEPFESGTLVVWSKVDRLTDGGNYGSAIQERLQELTRFLARAYRIFISKGLYIELNGKYITLQDPLFLLKNPKVIENFGEDLRAKIVADDNIEIDGHEVNIKVTLYPTEFRSIEGQGGREKKNIKKEADSRFKGLHIPDNEGHISIVRNGREIYYDIVPKLLPSGVEKIDRFIGIEVSFPAILDEYLQVRHVKRGAEPVTKLREELKKTLKRPIEVAREEIRAVWRDTKIAESNKAKQHQIAEEAVKKAEINLPGGKGGLQHDKHSQDKILNAVILDLGIDPEKEPEKAEEAKQRVLQLPITIIDGNWPGRELFEITHLNGKAIIRINHRHPFIQQVYDPLDELSKRDSSTVTAEEAISIAKKAQIGLDILFMAYAKAENMAQDPNEKYGDLRSYWGQHAQAYTREALGDK